jgi:thiol-disulfide isomerase/thioredoxin
MKHLSFLAFSLGALALSIIFAAPRPIRAIVVSPASGGLAVEKKPPQGRTQNGTRNSAQEQSPSKASGQSASATASPEADKAIAPSAPLAVREADAAAIKQLLQRDPKQPRPLLINFWATWCEPCRQEFPDLVRIDADYRARGLEFITISLDDVAEIKTSVPQFLQEMHAPMPAYLLNPSDPDALVAVVDPTWGGALPATFLFDAQGQLAFKHMGRIKVEELRAALEKVLGGK